MRKLMSFIVVCLLAVAAYAQREPQPTPYAEQTWPKQEKEIVDLQQKIWNLMAKKDTNSLRTLFHDQAMFVHMGGYWGKEQELQAIGNGFLWYKKADIFHVDVKFVGADALVYSTITLTAGVGDREVVTPFYVTSLFKKEKGRWQLGSFIFTTRISGPDGNKVRIEHVDTGDDSRNTAKYQSTVPALNPQIRLSNNVMMPQFGIGTFLMRNNKECKQAVLTALRAGYRHIDTAHAYQDEQGVGEAVNEFCKESGVSRAEIWITSKLWPTEYADPTAIDKMLKRLGLEYIDLVYLHQPVGDVKAGWRNLEKAVKERKVRCLGVSNFEVKGAEELYKWCVDSTEIKPVVLQMECHPYAQRKQESELIKKSNMAIECWYPLGGAASRGELLRDPVITEIARNHHATAAQIILAWHIQTGHSVILKSTNPAHIQENIDALRIRLTDAEMQQMNDLDKADRFYKMDINATRQFVNVPLPDQQDGGNDA
ncbi:MAG: aldo/keto reductase [Phocaeicola sp.]|uniref:aldo/keto reductase n=1 Tax=Phocaeicola TaxID=909656 RepID=UPI00234EAA39|nr:aldo/keto reductase [Phocaeicola oris]MCE2616937.1 aldo/keto reductase [Phocaeicola oris]